MRRLLWSTAIATLLLVVLAAFASSAFPDGLERVAAVLGFASRSSTPGPASPFANYEARFFQSHWAAQISAGLLGVALLYGFGVVFGRAVRRKRQNASRNSG